MPPEFGHIATSQQQQLSVTYSRSRGVSEDTIMRREAANLAAAEIELARGTPFNTIGYQIVNGELTSPNGETLRSMIDPPVEARHESYQAMLPHNIQNLLDAQRALVSGEKTEVLVPSLASDYNSEYGVIYRYYRQGDHVRCDCISAPKDLNDFKEFYERAFPGAQLELSYNADGGVTPGNSFRSEKTELTLGSLIQAVRDTFGDRIEHLSGAKGLQDQFMRAGSLASSYDEFQRLADLKYDGLTRDVREAEEKRGPLTTAERIAVVSEASDRRHQEIKSEFLARNVAERGTIVAQPATTVKEERVATATVAMKAVEREERVKMSTDALPVGAQQESVAKSSHGKAFAAPDVVAEFRTAAHIMERSVATGRPVEATPQQVVPIRRSEKVTGGELQSTVEGRSVPVEWNMEEPLSTIKRKLREAGAGIQPEISTAGARRSAAMQRQGSEQESKWPEQRADTLGVAARESQPARIEQAGAPKIDSNRYARDPVYRQMVDIRAGAVSQRSGASEQKPDSTGARRGELIRKVPPQVAVLTRLQQRRGEEQRGENVVSGKRAQSQLVSREVSKAVTQEHRSRAAESSREAAYRRIRIERGESRESANPRKSHRDGVKPQRASARNSKLDARSFGASRAPNRTSPPVTEKLRSATLRLEGSKHASRDAKNPEVSGVRGKLSAAVRRTLRTITRSVEVQAAGRISQARGSQLPAERSATRQRIRRHQSSESDPALQVRVRRDPMSELKASRLRNGPSTDTRPSSAEKKIAISRLKELAGNFERAARRRKANIPQNSQRSEAAPVNRVPTREWRSVRAGLLPLIRMYRQMKVELHDGSLPTISLRQVSVIIGALRVVQSAPLHRIAPHRRQKVLRMIARRIGRLLGVLRGSGEFDERLQQWLKIFQRSERYKKIRYWEREGAAFDRLKVGLMDSSETR